MFSIESADVKTIGGKLQEEASEYSRTITQIYADVEDLRTTWQGTDSDSYVNRVTEKRSSIESLGTAIDEYGQFLIDTSEKYNNLRENIIQNSKNV